MSAGTGRLYTDGEHHGLGAARPWALARYPLHDSAMAVGTVTTSSKTVRLFFTRAPAGRGLTDQVSLP
jgi:hypothetical protein